jgi:RNA polymerase sigma-70 factor, ECF subfamily
MVDQLDSDQKLIRQAQAGEAEAVTVLYRRHAPVIYRYLYVRLSDRNAAEDLTGEVFLKMIEGLPRYEDRGMPFGAWLFRIAHDRLVDHFRRNNLRQHEPLLDTLPDSEDGTESAALRRVEHHTLLGLLSGLTEEQQLALQLRFIEGHSLEETASLMQKTVGAIKALQHRALRQMARQLEAEA